jgi:Kyakuja-Dileera-Zisupton transposase/CxC4 like cysteine cluster associated with KDZ transposases
VAQEDGEDPEQDESYPGDTAAAEAAGEDPAAEEAAAEEAVVEEAAAQEAGVANVEAHAQLSFPYPAGPEMLLATMHHSSHGIPEDLRPPMPGPEEPCKCGNVATCAYVVVNQSCMVYYPPPVCGRKMPLLKLRCSACKAETLYDGTATGMFLFSTASCISLDILYGYAMSLNIDGRTMAACWNELSQRYDAWGEARAVNGGVYKFCSQPLYRAIVYAWLDRVDRPYLFHCPECKDAPSVLIGDATSESIQAHHYNGEAVTLPEQGIDVAPRCRTRAQRCCVSDPDHREALKEFAACVGTGTLEEFTSMYGDEQAGTWQALLTAANTCGLGPGVQDLKQLCLAGGQAARPASTKRLGDMLLCFASVSPTISYVPLAVVDLLQFTDEQSFNPAVLALLHVEAPLLLHFCTVLEEVCPTGSAGVGTAMLGRHRDLHDHLMYRAGCCAIGGPSSHDVALVASSSSSSECLRTGSCIGVPQVRHRLVYELDRSTEDYDCKHSFVSGSHGSRRTGGIFTWFCKHGVCYGFYIIPNAEGRNEAFSFLYKYFKVAPKVVVYDCACQLQDYCLNRQPAHFKHTTFLIDRLHWYNHTTCARSYNINLYRSHVALNTQIAEQVNSYLKRLKSSVSQMKQDNFMRCVRFSLEMWNERKVKMLLAAMADAVR